MLLASLKSQPSQVTDYLHSCWLQVGCWWRLYELRLFKQHFCFRPWPPNIFMSKQYTHSPQSSCVHGEHPHLLALFVPVFIVNSYIHGNVTFYWCFHVPAFRECTPIPVADCFKGAVVVCGCGKAEACDGKWVILGLECTCICILFLVESWSFGSSTFTSLGKTWI